MTLFASAFEEGMMLFATAFDVHHDPRPITATSTMKYSAWGRAVPIHPHNINPKPRMLVRVVYRGRLEDQQLRIIQGATRPEEDEWSITLLFSVKWEPSSP